MNIIPLLHVPIFSRAFFSRYTTRIKWWHVTSNKKTEEKVRCVERMKEFGQRVSVRWNRQGENTRSRRSVSQSVSQSLLSIPVIEILSICIDERTTFLAQRETRTIFIFLGFSTKLLIVITSLQICVLNLYFKM